MRTPNIGHFAASCLLVAVLSLATAGRVAPQAVAPARTALVNPLLPSGPDPWVTKRGDFYYFMSTTGGNLTIRRTRSIADLAGAESKVIWTPPPSGPYSHNIWAPELHFLGGKWYLYFAADDGKNEEHRIWVLEGDGAEPLECKWSLKGKVADPADKWAIDPTVLQDNGRVYLFWAGWPGDRDGTENLYIARLRNPWTVEGDRVEISTPQYAWEKVGDRPGQTPPHVNVNEAPEVLPRNGKIFLTYSASGCWTDSYALGMLTATQGSDLLQRSSWKKNASPVFSGSPKAKAYGPGHGSFFPSPDGKNDWMIYHANPQAKQGCGDTRSPRAQPIRWKTDGTPDFGVPARVGAALDWP